MIPVAQGCFSMYFGQHLGNVLEYELIRMNGQSFAEIGTIEISCIVSESARDGVEIHSESARRACHPSEAFAPVGT